jgi:carboxymuconolactone decarboxylase family protein
MKPMYLKEVETDTLPGDRGNLVRQMLVAGIPVPQIQYLFAFKPEATDHLAQFTQAVMRGPSALSPAQRELIAAFTSQLNACPF